MRTFWFSRQVRQRSCAYWVLKTSPTHWATCEWWLSLIRLWLFPPWAREVVVHLIYDTTRKVIWRTRRIIFGLCYGTYVGVYITRRRGKGGTIYILRVMNLGSCVGHLKVSEAGATSKFCIYIRYSNITATHLHTYVFGPQASDGGCPLALTHGVTGEMLHPSLCARLVNHFDWQR